MDRVGRRGKWLNLSTTSDEHSVGPEVIAHSFWWFCLHIKISLWTRRNALDQISGDWWVLHDFVCMWPPPPNEKTCQFYIWLRSYTYVHNVRNNPFLGGRILIFSQKSLADVVGLWYQWEREVQGWSARRHAAGKVLASKLMCPQREAVEANKSKTWKFPFESISEWWWHNFLMTEKG